MDWPKGWRDFNSLSFKNANCAKRKNSEFTSHGCWLYNISKRLLLSKSASQNIKFEPSKQHSPCCEWHWQGCPVTCDADLEFFCQAIVVGHIEKLHHRKRNDSTAPCAQRRLSVESVRLSSDRQIRCRTRWYLQITTNTGKYPLRSDDLRELGHCK